MLTETEHNVRLFCIRYVFFGQLFPNTLSLAFCFITRHFLRIPRCLFMNNSTILVRIQRIDFEYVDVSLRHFTTKCEKHKHAFKFVWFQMHLLMDNFFYEPKLYIIEPICLFSQLHLIISVQTSLTNGTMFLNSKGTLSSLIDYFTPKP